MPIHQKNRKKSPNLEDIQKLEDFQKKHADILTYGQMMWFLRHRDKNGLTESGSLIFLSKKFYIDEPAFARWFLDHKMDQKRSAKINGHKKAG